jgi:hypothetical protein
MKKIEENMKEWERKTKKVEDERVVEGKEWKRIRGRRMMRRKK